MEMNKWRKRKDFWEDPADETPGTKESRTSETLRILISSCEPGRTWELGGVTALAKLFSFR